MLPEVLSPLTRGAIGAPVLAGGAPPPSPHDLEQARQAVAVLRAERPALVRLSSRRLFDRAAGIIGRAGRLLGDHIALTVAAQESAARIQSACAEIDDPAGLLRLMGPLGVDSAEPTLALWSLGRLVAESRLLTVAFEQGTDELAARLRAVDGDGVVFLDHFDRFLYEFGSQGPSDWDLMSPTWETHPGLALAAVERLRLVDEDDAPALRQARLAADRSAELAGAAPGLASAAETVGRLLVARVRSKVTITRLLHEARMPFYEIGRRLVEQGYLDRVADFAMVTLDEFPAFLDDPEGFALVVRDRRRDHDGRLRPAPGPVEGDGLAGVAASGGRATGPVRLLSNPADPGHVRPGDIVVAPVADPSWVPLFVPAGAVVVATGDRLCHAAVACRELGIPGVFGCLGAATRLPDGAIVTVDGTAGTVTLADTAARI